MADLESIIAADLAEYYKHVAAQLHVWADPLTEEQFWCNPHGYGNSAGHLVLHVTGNLNYYIGARVAETGYVRDRPREFTEAKKPAKTAVLEAFDRTIEMVVATIAKQSAADWQKPYSAELEPEAKDRFMIFVRCAAHAYHHVGQIIYLNRELTRKIGAKTTPA